MAAAAFGNAGAGAGAGMAGGMAGGPRKAKKAMTLPINQIFRMLQNRVRVQIWLYENTSLRLEGVIVGFDEYMNLVLDQAEEIDRRHKDRKKLGMVMLKGENITLMHEVAPSK